MVGIVVVVVIAVVVVVGGVVVVVTSVVVVVGEVDVVVGSPPGMKPHPETPTAIATRIAILFIPTRLTPKVFRVTVPKVRFSKAGGRGTANTPRSVQST